MGNAMFSSPSPLKDHLIRAGSLPRLLTRFLLAWLASGWLSVNPNQWFPGRAFAQPALERYAGETLPRFPAGDGAALAGLLSDTALPPREIRLAWQAGVPVMLVATAATTHAYHANTGAPLALSPLPELPSELDRHPVELAALQAKRHWLRELFELELTRELKGDSGTELPEPAPQGEEARRARVRLCFAKFERARDELLASERLVLACL